MTHTSHESQAAAQTAREPIRAAVLTVSDTRTPDNDISGDLVARLATEAGMKVIDRTIVRDEPDAISDALDRWLGDFDIDAILSTGGTGIARRDTTIEVVRKKLTAELDGFGELFRMLSWEQVGAAAMLSRAVAGLVARDPKRGGDTFVFAMPGSPNAVESAMTTLIVPQLPHLVWERSR